MGQHSRLLKSGRTFRGLARALVVCSLGMLVVASSLVAQDVNVKSAKAVPEDAEKLLKDFPKGWLHFSSDPAIPFNATWQLSREDDTKEPVLICLGKPDGYVRTEKEYDNFELGMEWKYPTDPNGNSGILLFIVDKDMIWPKSIQVQLHRPTAGSVFASNGAKVDNPLPAKDLSRPVNEWNECVITSVDGKVSVSMNGHKVGEVTGCMPAKGCVGLQSEGSEIHFRKLWIKAIAPEEKRATARKLSVIHKRAPVCPPEHVFTNLPEGELLLLTPGEAHRARVQAQRISRAFRRLEVHGKIRPGTFRNLSPFGVTEAPWIDSGDSLRESTSP